ncbi:MAG: hypothetical protein V4538_17345 [Bacteroidota bacterium]
MNIDRIKISQEINFNGMPTWIGLEASILPDENEKDSLRQLQKVITEYQTEEQQAYSKSKWAKKDEPEIKLSKEERQKAEISGCTDKTVLESYRLIVKKYPNLQATYDETMDKILKTA